MVMSYTEANISDRKCSTFLRAPTEQNTIHKYLDINNFHKAITIFARTATTQDETLSFVFANDPSALIF